MSYNDIRCNRYRRQPSQGATSFKSSSSVRLENILLALSTTSRQELIATCTDNLWDVIVISPFFDPCPSFVQPRPSAIARKRHQNVLSFYGPHRTPERTAIDPIRVQLQHLVI